MDLHTNKQKYGFGNQYATNRLNRFGANPEKNLLRIYDNQSERSRQGYSIPQPYVYL